MTRRRFQTSVTTLVLLGFVALGASGCGRRGPLEAPPDPLVQVKAKDPGGKPRKPRKVPIQRPTTPFILDDLV